MNIKEFNNKIKSLEAEMEALDTRSPVATNSKDERLYQILVDENTPKIIANRGLPLARFRDWEQAERFCELANETLETIFLSLD
jgi:hypothetical protein